MALVTRWFRIPFWQRVLAGFALGALAGWLMGPAAATWFQPLGTLYVTLIKMIAVPLVFFAVINAVASLAGQKSVAALGGRTFAWFAAMPPPMLPRPMKAIFMATLSPDGGLTAPSTALRASR